MSTKNQTGWLLIVGAIGVIVPYTLLTVTFDYPAILRQDTGVILTNFYAGGASLILTWFAFALLGLPLLVGYIQLGAFLEKRLPNTRWFTTLGVTGLIVQMIGLLRWVFVVPLLAHNYVHGNELTREANKVGFQLIHQFGGVLLGEHLGQLFTVIWTLAISYAFAQLTLFPKWVIGLGFVSALVYLLAQLELLATVIPNLPMIEVAGFLGSTLWLIWLVIVGGMFQKMKTNSITPT